MPTPLKVKDSATIRDDLLRSERNGLIARGVTTPQLGPGSLEFVRSQALGNELAALNAAIQTRADSMMPDTAVGADLARICAQYGLVAAAATSSIGNVILTSSQSTNIPLNSQLVDANGLRYQVTTGGLYANLAPVPIQAIDTGYATNHVTGDVLKWTAQPAYADPTALVDAYALAGGKDAETDEALRSRLFSRLQSPQNNANWPQVAAIAEASSPVVQKAYPYPAANGPSTLLVAVVQAPQVITTSTPTLTSTAKNRNISSTILTNTIAPYVQGQMPEYVETVVRTVSNVATNVAVGLSLPSSPAAVPAGPGGGWVDGNPWPQMASYASGGAAVTALDGTTPTTKFTMNATGGGSPYVGAHICCLDSTTWTLRRARIAAVSGSSGSWVITIDTPFPNVFSTSGGTYIFPDCVNAQAYCDALLAAFGLMGPGELYAPGNVALTRGYRHPSPTQSWPYSLGATQLRALSNVGAEVLDAAWQYRQTTTPGQPATVYDTNGPLILVPNQIGFYPL